MSWTNCSKEIQFLEFFIVEKFMKCMLCWGKLTSLNVVSALLSFSCNSNSKFELKNEYIYDFVIHKRNDNDTIWSNKTLGSLFTVEQYCSLDLIEFSICF